MRIGRSFLASGSLVASLSAADAAGAQGPAWAAASSGIREGARVRVAAAGAYVEGQVSRERADSLVLLTASGRWAVPASGVDSLWVRRGRVGRGAAVGALAGAAALGVLALAPCRDGGSDPCTGNDGPHLLALGAGAGGALGALLGAVVGSGVRRWERRHP